MPLQSCSTYRNTSLQKQWLLHMLLLISLSPVGVIANLSGDGLEEDGWNNALIFQKLQELLLFSWVSVKTVVCAFISASQVCFTDLCAIEHAMIESYLVSVLGLCLCRGALWTLQNVTIMATLSSSTLNPWSQPCLQITESTSDSEWWCDKPLLVK